MTPNEIKKDCERKARAILIKVNGCKISGEDCFHEKCHHWGSCALLENEFVELLLSESLIVQKREEQLSEKMHGLEVENCAMHVEVDKVQKRVEEKDAEIEKLKVLCGLLEGVYAETIEKSCIKYREEISRQQKQIDELKVQVEWLKVYPSAHEYDRWNKKIDELTKENVVLREAIAGVNKSVEILRKSNPMIKACVDDLGELGLGFARADYALNNPSLPVKQLEAKLEAGKKAAEMLILVEMLKNARRL